MRAAWLMAVLAVAGAGATPRAAAEPAWTRLFDGMALGQWEPTAFGGEGEVTVEDGVIRVGMGSNLSGITWGGEFPRTNYELAVDARRDDGIDFFCGLTFPVGEASCSLIVGGWGGSVVGLSSIDGRDASENETTSTRSFESGRWYRVRVRVTESRIECFLDDEHVVDQALAGRRISIRDEVQPSQPLGIATYATAASFRNLRWRAIDP